MNNIKEAFDIIGISQELENKIINNTINRETKRKFKLAYVLVLIFSIVATITVTVNAEEIGKFWLKLLNNGSVQTNNGEKHKLFDEVIGISFNDLGTSETYVMKEITLADFEKKLGVKILKYDKSENDNGLMTLIPDNALQSERKGHIDRVYYYRENIKKYNLSDDMKFYYGLSIETDLISDKASDYVKHDFLEELNVMQEKQLIEKYYSDNLKTDIIMYEYVSPDSSIKIDLIRADALFVYNNIRYTVHGIFKDEIPVNDIKELIENLHE